MSNTTALGSTRLMRSSGYRSRSRFDALVNFRDLGGHPAGLGGVTRHGVVFRADGVHRCTTRDIATLEEMGVRRVVDLRTAHERVDDGSFASQHPTIDYRHVPLLDDVSGLGEIVHEEPLVVSYLHMIDQRGGRIVEALHAVVGAPGPVVFHCTAGKDRTGVLAALLLSAVGVPADLVVEDYAKSQMAMERLIAWYRENRSGAAGVQEPTDDNGRARLMGAEPRWMDTVLAHLDRRYGGAERYLLAQGTTPETLRHLRRLLLG